MQSFTKVASLFLASICLLLLSACMEPKTPEDTADYFWKAMLKRNVEAAQKLSMDGSVAKLLDKLKPQTFELGDIDTNGNRAVIKTTLTQLDGTETKDVLLTTVLFYQNEKWRVSIKQTDSSLLPGALHKLFRNLEEFGSELGDKLGTSFNNSLQETLPVIEEVIQEGVKQLEDSLEFNIYQEQKALPQRLPEDEMI